MHDCLSRCSSDVLNAASQQPPGQLRAQEIAAVFSKHKTVAKQVHGVTREKYKDVRSEPVTRQDPKEYSGTYEVSDVDYVITIRVGAEGNAHVYGHEQGRTFELQNARIEGSLLTGTKVYRDAARERFEQSGSPL